MFPHLSSVTHVLIRNESLCTTTILYQSNRFKYSYFGKQCFLQRYKLKYCVQLVTLGAITGIALYCTLFQIATQLQYKWAQRSLRVFYVEFFKPDCISLLITFECSWYPLQRSFVVLHDHIFLWLEFLCTHIDCFASPSPPECFATLNDWMAHPRHAKPSLSFGRV